MISALRAAKTKPQLALLLGIDASFLTNVLYRLKPSSQYKSFTIPKKSGGVRTIYAPSEELKSLQRALSSLLQDCQQEIYKSKGPKFKSTLSHGFVRERSIMTNAVMHLNKKSVLNIDLKDFFDQFNFGRVRGFFISNTNFQLDPAVATVIAQIACYDNKLPQGSPCSPVISNLITHSLDIRLASLAKDNSCTYTRYADDITISTREKDFPVNLMSEETGEYSLGKKLESEIRRAGFEINHKKTRIQYKDSRQDVTGLIVNKRPGVKCEYWRTVRSQCHALFNTGEFIENESSNSEKGNVFVLEGRLNFIDQIDYFNRRRSKPILNPEYQLSDHGSKTRRLLSGRERTFSRFLYYKMFYGNDKPTILCEGKTDNVYLKAALNRLAAGFPRLVKPRNGKDPYELLVQFFNYTERTRFLLELSGGTPYLREFIASFDEHFNYFKAPMPTRPVIMVFDNDDGFKVIESVLKGKKVKPVVYPNTLAVSDFRNSEFIHVIHNLYIVLTPRAAANGDTAIEDLFSQAVRDVKLGGKGFTKKNNIDKDTEYGKEFFASKVVVPNRNNIDFSGFDIFLKRIMHCIDHFDTVKLTKP
ncbi:retron Ec67 family RNA-directed DNA polymerase/endonuclease [Pseudomonas sp. RTB3]|uniref:retron Ec67 family RNA-directed DNA polymerase/endonuclease n=1 Tax=unclassified Pseudomonas TaxID=196821 RepID=UPI002B22E018|nr:MULTISPECIES: retron Ec67 family RNA-directed DNA polymerase/endonuclease [unclassified Pseudomonas]MEB0006340.1 retron Ec67 family RNA-directed DNA polymerase/endonuclease [Pseudomonas sp. RTB2]MEB0018580.1 retron Ec67 family RNA-directed DNA polymerase/endonuclease [Pseudomonas sp. RTB3]MEB0269243.1 retron Ec67 family RNA-directed DNA polymerase/endonuclease [Pseudomonas sp. 5B4]